MFSCLIVFNLIVVAYLTLTALIKQCFIVMGTVMLNHMI